MDRFHAPLLALLLLGGCAGLPRQGGGEGGPVLRAQLQVTGLLGQPRPLRALALELRDPAGRAVLCHGGETLRCPPLPGARYRLAALHLTLPEGVRRLPLPEGAPLAPGELAGARLEARVQLGYRRPLAVHARLVPVP